MWGGCLFQAGFLALLPLCFSPLPPATPSTFTCRREHPGPCSSPPEHTSVANGETCSPLISAQCLSPAAGLGGKPLPFSILLPLIARGAALGRAGAWAQGTKLQQQSYAVRGARGLASRGCPHPTSGRLGNTTKYWVALFVCARWLVELCRQADEVCEGTWRASVCARLWS